MKISGRWSLLLACFVLSGFAGLIYQTVWMQQFALVFGTSELALATVLAAYMAGLAAGAAGAGRWASDIQRPILIYALLELGIGLTALAVPSMIRVASHLQVVLLGSDGLTPALVDSGLFYLFSSFLILLIPTSLMGATLPLLARHAIAHPQQIGARIGALYAANTAGAAAGTWVAAFLLLPRIGLGPTIGFAAAINVVVFVLAALLARGALEVAQPTANPKTASKVLTRRWILPLILVSGAVSFTWEILWTRLLSHLIGGSVYAFATMLATFLIGLSLGAAVASRLASDAERSRRGFAGAQIAIAALSLAAFAVADHLPAVAYRWRDLGGWIPGVVLAGIALLPSATAIGATFPFSVRILTGDASAAPRASAQVFAWNTVGAILGALGTGYLLLPTAKFAGTAGIAAAVSLGLAMVTTLARPRPRLLISTAIAGLLMLAIWPPGTPWQVLRRGALGPDAVSGKILHYGVGRSGTVLLIEERLGWRLTSNGLPESSIGAPWQRPAGQQVNRWLTLLPFAARPEAKSLLVVGLGGGVSTEDLPRSLEEIHVVELEPEVIQANRKLSGLRRSDPLADPRLQIHLGDARGALRLTQQRFDIILSQPSHPWTSGAANLFTREFLELARERLAPDGVFIQWMGLTFVDEVLLRSFAATAVDVFPEVELYRLGQAFLILASPAPLDLSVTATRAVENEPRLWSRLGILTSDDVLATRVLDAAGTRRFAESGRVSTDLLNLFRTRSPRVLGRTALKLAVADQILADDEPKLPKLTAIDRLYRVRRLIRNGEGSRARRLAESSRDAAARDVGVGLTQLADGNLGAGELALRETLSKAPPDDPVATEALYGLLLWRYRQPIVEGRRVAFTERFPEDPGAAVIAAWRAFGAQDPQELRNLERRLAEIAERHPLFPEARRLRATWREATGDATHAVDGLELLEPLLAPSARTDDLLLYARCAARAGRSLDALAVVEEAFPRLAPGTAPARAAAEILNTLSGGGQIKTWREDLRKRLRGRSELAAR